MKNYLIVIFLTIVTTIHGQTVLYYLNSGFETSADQATWTASTDDASLSWKYQTGGQSLNPPIARQGTLNACLYKNVIPSKHGKLVSKVLDIGAAGKPILHFWHTQYNNVWGNDELRLLFRKNSSSAWDTVRTYTLPSNGWTERLVDIFAVGTKYKTDNFQFAFFATVGKGWGVDIDSVTVEETQPLPVFVKTMTINHQPNIVIPSGAPDMPVNSIVLKIYGNQGNAILKNITITPVGDGVQDLEPDSFKLFKTQDAYYTPLENNVPTRIAKGSLSNGKIHFTNINKTLDLGNNYLWVTVSAKHNIPADATVRFDYDIGAIQVNDTTLPSSKLTATQYQNLAEVVKFDDFESATHFLNLTPDFEIAKPLGKKMGGSADPSAAFSGSKILGTDLTGDGAYKTGIDSANAYYAYSDNINLKYYIDLGLFMDRKFEFGANTNAIIEISNDAGKNWTDIWDNQKDQIPDPFWEDWVDRSFSDFAAKKDSFKLRIGIIRNTTDLKPGFNIDNLAILGKHLENDIGVTRIIDPYSDCIHCNNDTVKVVFRNYAEGPSSDTIPVFFGLWGLDSLMVRDTIFRSIPKDDSIVFTFKSLAPFPKGDVYNKFVVGVNLKGDQDSRNDTLTKPLFIQQTLTSPALTDFETKSGLWFKKPGSTWSCADMSLTIPTDPKSPYIWVLSAAGNYPTSDNSYIESNCYDFSDKTREIVEFKYWANTEALKDGARLDYSPDHAATWKILYDNIHKSYWGWYPDTVAALGSKGWSGSQNWKSVKAVIPVDMDTCSRAKFRLDWGSDAATTHSQGFAINDFKVYPAPQDFGASTIIIPKDTCQLCASDYVKVYVKNYGYNKLAANDTMIIGVKIASQTPVIDTFHVSSDILPGDSALFSVYAPMSVSTPGTYIVKAYTLIEKNPFFYSPKSNDTTSKSFNIWPLPYGIAEDTISSRRPDTVVIRPHYDPNYKYLWGDNSTDSVYHATSSKTYYLTVTDKIHGCHYHDSIYVELLFNDIGIDSIIWPRSSCSLGTAEKVNVQIRNLGTDSLIAGDKINVSYQLNSAGEVKDSLTLSSSFRKGAAKWFQFDHKTENMSPVGDYYIKAFSHFGGDTILSNDTISRTIKVFGFPSFNLGSDTVIKALSHTFHVYPGFADYLWSDGDTTATKTIDQSGLYWLQILDHNGCPASDSIDVWLKIRDLKASALLSPVSECNRTGTDQVNVQISNNGSDTIRSSDDLILSYKINQNARVSETIHIDNLLPGQTATHLFVPTVNLTSVGSYNFNITATAAGDLRAQNDTLNKTIYSRSNPVVNFGIQDYEPVKAINHLFDAGYSHDYTYLWQDNSVHQTFLATESGTVGVEVTDTVTGCIGGDTVYLNLDIIDYKVSSIGINSNACEGKYSNVVIGLQNNGNQLRPSAALTLKYMNGNTELFTENYVSTTNWLAGSIRNYTTKDTIDLNPGNNQQLKVLVTSDGDLRPENDLFSMNVNVLSKPVIPLESAQTGTLPMELDAGSGFTEYLWKFAASGETLSIKQLISATINGIYEINVKDGNGCSNSKKIFVNTEMLVNEFAAEGMKINIYPNPAIDNITIEAEFKNPGTYILEIFNVQNMLFETRHITTQKYKEEFNVSNLQAGIYFIRIHNNEMYHISKMIIQ